MTLDEMLALLPDNTTGAISAADLRTIVTGLYELGSTFGQIFSYTWATDLSPGAGKVGVDSWTMSGAHLLISETTEDGAALLFGIVDTAQQAQASVDTSVGSRIAMTVTGPSVDNGGWRDLPVRIDSVAGAAPANGQKVSVAFMVRP